MKENNVSNITPRDKDFSQWYGDVVAQADLAENSPVKGSIIIKPNGFAIWEHIQGILDAMFKERGVENAYFPLLIPESFIAREKKHVAGFSPELAVVTHGGGKKLAEPLVIRPTSETIIYDAFSRWIHSHRDLPMEINQWANVVRWEMRPRMFLRTTEFLWQEGHTAHATKDEARQYALNIMNEVYKTFVENYLAIPAIYGQKSESERFAGADETYTMEGLMQDGKSLQMGTSHLLGNNFAKSFNIRYSDENGELKYVEQTSWGVSTRLLGGIIMTHGDDKGIVMPPRIAPLQAVIIVINPKNDSAVTEYATAIQKQIGKKIRIKVDTRDIRPGAKHFEWEKRGVPLRIEIGPKETEQKSMVIALRHNFQKVSTTFDNALKEIEKTLENMHEEMFEKAKKMVKDKTRKVNSWKEFEKEIEKGGYLLAHWCGDADCEEKIKTQTKATTRCLPFDAETETGDNTCVRCGKPSQNGKRWLFGLSY